MPDETGSLAVAEPADTTGSPEVVETGSETVETAESGNESVDNLDSTSEKEGLTEKQPTKGKLNLADVVKKSGEALKAINPALPAALRTAAFEQSALYREFPGGLKEAVALKQAIGEYGGAEGVKEVVEANQDYQRLEQKYEKGDPAFLTDLADALPSSFAKIMPAGLAKWKSVDSEGYNHALAQVMTQTLDGANIQGTLATIWQNLDAEKQKPLKDAVESIWNALEGFRKVGDKAPERKVDPQAEVLSRREQELAEREQKLFLAPIIRDREEHVRTVAEKEISQSYQWDTTDPDVKKAVLERIEQEVRNISEKDKAFDRELKRLRERGDAKGLARHIKDFQDRVLPGKFGIVQRVAKLFAVKPKGAGTIVPKPKIEQAATNGAKPQQGWIRVAGMPKPQDVDRRKTTDDMILANRAIDKNGRQITWA